MRTRVLVLDHCDRERPKKSPHEARRMADGPGLLASGSQDMALTTEGSRFFAPQWRHSVARCRLGAFASASETRRAENKLTSRVVQRVWMAPVAATGRLGCWPTTAGLRISAYQSSPRARNWGSWARWGQSQNSVLAGSVKAILCLLRDGLTARPCSSVLS